MKKHTFILTVLLMTNIWPIHISYGFGNKATHPAITSKTVGETIDDYVENQLGMANGIQTQLKYNPEWYQMYIKHRMERGGYSTGGNNRTVLEWLKAGSVIEDEDPDILLDRIPSIRPRHHFHDPINNVGLNNKFDHFNYSKLFAWTSNIYPGEFDVTGQSAIVWAIKGTAPSKKPTTNNQCWEEARDNFYSALTDPESVWREYWLAMTFLELGSILHMIEDMGVPAHARNDFLFGHYQPPLGLGNDFENWVEKIIEQNGGQCPWSGNSAVAFDKLTKYFDANEYTGSYLNGSLPPNTWGLSECSNYQFLSTSTMFGCSGEKYQFPNPAKEHLGPDIIVPVADGNKIYFNGSNYGVTHIARESYTYYISDERGETLPVFISTNTTDDEQVFIDYANITVPRTIDYATGLVNYFFRGRLSVEQLEAGCDEAIIRITNNSDNSETGQALKGGIFELYWEDASGNRTPVSDFTVYEPAPSSNEWNPSSSTLQHEEYTKAIFTIPEGEVEKYILVYKGNICTNPADTDPDDSEAIAVCKFQFQLCPPCSPYSTPTSLRVTISGITMCSFDCCREPDWWAKWFHPPVGSIDIPFVDAHYFQDVFCDYCRWYKQTETGELYITKHSYPQWAGGCIGDYGSSTHGALVVVFKLEDGPMQIWINNGGYQFLFYATVWPDDGTCVGATNVANEIHAGQCCGEGPGGIIQVIGYGGTVTIEELY